MNDLISIQICTYNRASLIKEAIQSVLDQTYQDFEIIIIDDASTDNTREIVETFQDRRIKYFRNEINLGVTKSRNLAIKKSLGKYIAILDSDDFWNDKKKLEKQIDFLKNNPFVAVLGTQALKITIKGEIVGKLKKETRDINIRQKILQTNQFVNSSVLILKEAIETFDGYDENLLVAEDYDMFLKIGQKYKLANLESFSTSYRVGNQGYTSNKKNLAIHHYRLIKKYKKVYPKYFIALIKSYLRIVLAG